MRSDKIENKVILARDFGPVNLVGNFIFEREINKHENWEFEYAAVISYGVTPRVRVGLEMKQALGNDEDFRFRRARKLVIVPGIYASVTPHVRILAGPAFGLTRESDEFALKSIVEVEF